MSDQKNKNENELEKVETVSAEQTGDRQEDEYE